MAAAGENLFPTCLLCGVFFQATTIYSPNIITCQIICYIFACLEKVRRTSSGVEEFPSSLGGCCASVVNSKRRTANRERNAFSVGVSSLDIARAGVEIGLKND